MHVFEYDDDNDGDYNEDENVYNLIRLPKNYLILANAKARY